MSLPFHALGEHLVEVGLVVGALLGFAFGFVLERAGFGRSTKLAAQFYLYDMTVFKVMFGAIVTAMLGLMVAAGVGLVDLTAISTAAASPTFVWPMLVGGLLLGMGFIVSGYCPGTSVVATASGHLDGAATIFGVGIGSLVFAEAYPWLEPFYLSGAREHFFLYQWLGIHPALLAVIIAVVAVLAFVGAEKVERIMTKRIEVAAQNVDEEVRRAPVPRRLAFGWFGVTAAAVAVTLLLPVAGPAQASPAAPAAVSPRGVAQRMLDEPWTMRIIDVRGDACVKGKPIPGSQCVTPEEVSKLGLQYATGKRDLVVVTADGTLPPDLGVAGYPGTVLILEGGYQNWKRYALSKPPSPAPGSSRQAREEYEFRAALYAALANQKMAAPARAPVKGFVPKKKKKGGGCG